MDGGVESLIPSIVTLISSHYEYKWNMYTLRRCPGLFEIAFGIHVYVYGGGDVMWCDAIHAICGTAVGLGSA